MDFNFALLNVSFILLVGIFIYIIRVKRKKQIHSAFLGIIGSLLIWTSGYLGLFYWYYAFSQSLDIFVKIVLTGIILTPSFVFLFGYIFAYNRIKNILKFKLFFIIPIISIVLLYTNDYHKLFYTYFSAENIKYRVFGPWFIVHTIYSYSLIITGLAFLTYFTIKNSGFFSNQSKLIIIGIIFPFAINILITLQVGNLPYYYESISFSIAIFFFAFAIFKFRFLNIAPIALQRIVDLISDSYIVINEDLEIIDYNKTFVDTFKEILNINRNDSFIDMLTNSSDTEQEKILEIVLCAIEKRIASSYEHHIKGDKFDKHFIIEITPINSNDSIIGTIILFKDITDHKRYIETINRNQQTLMERERLAFLGELIGGIAHNLKTPIMSVSGGLEGIYDLIKEYDESIEDKNVTKEDHHEIAKEMEEWIIKLKPHLSYMSEIISTVKDQAVHLNAVTSYSFTLSEMIKRIEILVKNELKLHHCELNMDVRMDETVEIFGDISSLIQVFDNLIINAIDAYGEASGEIDLIVEKADDNNILFTVRDYACGMDNDVKNKLFKQMVTTKGKGGTGLGLYMSHSTIKGRFGGDIWFDSEKGKGTTFFIQIPKKFETTNSEQNSNHEQIA